ncbi:uncharacterized protein LOC121861841 [Homarus americanus]|uniref:uncharacterized protein LOC121861841 n=1 Tax=Homarus americanus TaxID=6706 RepID=UPI001C43E174|nr:uncharacterized protein LOC121861841 [Homarus americanus]
MEKIGGSSLKPLQKIKILKSQIIPRLQYRYVKGSCSMNLLRALDRTLRDRTRQWLRLPRTLNTAAIGLPMRDGGVGVPSLLETVAQQKMGLLRRLEASDDPAVRFIASGGLWGREVGAMARHFRVGHVDNNTLSQFKRSLLRKKREEWSTSWHGKGAENFLRNDLGPGRKAIDLLRLRSQTINCRKNGQYSVLDVCVPFESDINNLRLAEQHKIDKYRAHEVDIRRFIANNSSLPPVAAVNFLGVAFGARGGIRPATIKLLSRLGIRRAGIEILVTMAIEGSINILRSLRLQADG